MNSILTIEVCALKQIRVRTFSQSVHLSEEFRMDENPNYRLTDECTKENEVMTEQPKVNEENVLIIVHGLI